MNINEHLEAIFGTETDESGNKNMLNIDNVSAEPVEWLNFSPQFEAVQELFDHLLAKERNKAREKLKKIIMCQNCNGIGALLGEGLGVAECGDCGGDGHGLYGCEGIKLKELLKNY
jgi:hypothetical protein